MTAASLHDPSNGMLGVWGMLAGEWTVMMVLAWYLEQVCVCAPPRKARGGLLMMMMTGTSMARVVLWWLHCTHEKHPDTRTSTPR
jgi:hypothetical protein